MRLLLKLKHGSFVHMDVKWEKCNEKSNSECHFQVAKKVMLFYPTLGVVTTLFRSRMTGYAINTGHFLFRKTLTSWHNSNTIHADNNSKLLSKQYAILLDVFYLAPL